jgi:MFS superfamily sulfate permease-like transporter
MTYWVEEVNGKGVVVGPSVDAPQGVDLLSPIGYPTQALAQAAAGGVSTVQAKAGSVAKDVVGGVDVGALALRIAEILLGIVLIGVGLAKLTGAENVISKAAVSGIGA